MAVNKLDEVAPDQLQSRLEVYSELLDVEEQLAISALRGDNVPCLLQLLVDRLPEDPRYFPEDMVTDRPESFILAELVREQVLKLTREEVPHSVGVVVEELAERDNNMLYVNATILVERSSQKGILIGRGGRMLKDIGKRARNEIEALLGTRCYLDLWVKVSKDWRNREREVQRLGYGEQS
jgi:GTP-binding protein Era